MSEIKTFDQLVQAELSKYDTVIPAVEELKSQFMSLAIVDINDKENYEKVKEGIKFIISKRTAIEEKRKELKADSLAFGRAVDARAKEIVSLINPIEEHLKAQKLKIDEEIESIKRQGEERRQAIIMARHNKLLEIGFSLVGNEYTWTNPNNQLDGECFPSVNIETMSEQEFSDYVLTMSYTISREKEKYEFEQKKILDEKIKLDEERLALLKVQEELKAEQERMRKELEELKIARITQRLSHLTNLGLTIQRNQSWENVICFTRFDKNIPIVDEEKVRDCSQGEWDLLLQNITKRVSDLTKECEINQENERERIRKEAEIKAANDLKEKEILEERLEAERIAMLSDKEKLSDYSRRLLDVPTPEIKTIKWSKELKKVTEVIVNYL